MTIKEISKNLDDYKNKEKEKIKSEKSRFKRFWLYIKYLLVFIWKWLFMTLKDWHSWLIFFIVVIIVGSEVWVPLLLGLIFKNKALLAFAGACEAFWLAPLTPFIPLCLFITFWILKIREKIIKKRQDNS